MFRSYWPRTDDQVRFQVQWSVQNSNMAKKQHKARVLLAKKIRNTEALGQVEMGRDGLVDL